MSAEKAMQPLVLASASPRRSELLQQIGVRFTVQPADIDESVLSGELPVDYVVRMAVEKAQAGQRRARLPAIVLGADTAVVVDSSILGKPENEADCRRMLKLLSGRAHTVMSAVAVTDGVRVEYRCSHTEVVFRQLDDDAIGSYWRSGEPADKAGAYAIQGLGALLVENINGSYSGVVGLPLFETAELLVTFGCHSGLKIE